MKGSNGGGSGGLYVMAMGLVILFGCLAVSAQCRSSQLLKKVGRTGGVYITGAPSNTSVYHTEIECTRDAAADDESKLTLIFCTIKCYCHGVHGDDICHCCQKPSGPVCYDKLSDCQANCPICNPNCPPEVATTTTTNNGAS